MFDFMKSAQQRLIHVCHVPRTHCKRQGNEGGDCAHQYGHNDQTLIGSHFGIKIHVHPFFSNMVLKNA
jgi:hypothetical protein